MIAMGGDELVSGFGPEQTTNLRPRFYNILLTAYILLRFSKRNKTNWIEKKQNHNFAPPPGRKIIIPFRFSIQFVLFRCEKVKPK